MKMNAKQLVAAAVLSAVGITGSAVGQVITEDHKVSTKESAGRLGWSLAIDGSVAVVGAPGTGAQPEGSAFVIDTVTGNVLFELVPDEDEDFYIEEFGRSVAVRGGFATIGARGSSDDFPSIGAAYVFDVNTGQQVFKIYDSDPDGLSEDGFGTSVAMNESVVVVGDPVVFSLTDNAAAYVFDLQTGELLVTVTPTEQPALGSSFGNTVAISETRFAVGFEDKWQVDVFDLDSGDRINSFTPPPLTIATGYGNAIGMNESLLVVGAWGDQQIEGQSGAVYVYDVVSGESLYKITPPLEDEAFRFGWSVDVDGSIAVIGAFFDDPDFFEDPEDQKRGAAYVYDLNTGELLFKFRPTDSELSDDFGRAVAIDGQTVAVGRPGEDAAYFFTLPPFGCPGDATGDGAVDLADLNLVLANFGSAASEGDANGDGQVDLTDLNLVLANFGSNCD